MAFNFADVAGRLAGQHLGREGTLMTQAREFLPFPPESVFVVLMVAGLYLAIREFRRDEKEGMAVPLVLIMISGSFLLGAGFAISIMYLAVAVLAGNTIVNFKHMSQKGVVGSVVLLMGIGYLLFENIWSLLIVGGMGAVIIMLLKHKTKEKEMGTGKASKLREAAGYAVGVPKKVIRGLGKVAGKAKGGLGRLTAGIARLTQRTTETGIHAATVAAGTEAESNKVVEMGKAEIAAEGRDIQVLSAIRQTAQDMKKVALSGGAEEAVAERLKGDVKRLEQLFGEVVKDEKYGDKYRHDATKAIVETSQIMMEAAESAQTILSQEIREDKDLRRKAHAELKHLETEIRKRDENLKRLAAQIAHGGPGAGALAAQKGNIEKEQELAQQTLRDIGNIGSRLDAILAKGKRVLAVMKEEANKIAGLEKEAENFAANAEKLEAQIGEMIEKLEDAQKRFSEDIGRIEQQAMPESVLIGASTNAANIFKELGESVDKILELNEKDIEPIIAKNAEVLSSSWKLANATEYADRVSKFVTMAFEQIARMAANFGDEKEKKEAEKAMALDQMEKKIEIFADRKEKQIKAEVKKTYGDLSSAQNSIKSQIEYLQKEKGMIAEAQKETLEALASATAELTKKATAQLERAAAAGAKAEADLSKAARSEKQEKRAA